MEKRLYFGSCIAQRIVGTQTTINGYTLLAIASSKDEAIGTLARMVKNTYAPEHGWSAHAHDMFLIDDEAALKVASENYAELLARKVK